MNKEPYVAVQEAMSTITPKGEWLDISIKRDHTGVTMNVASKTGTFKAGMRDTPCGSGQECKKELSEGVSCYGGCEYHQNFLKTQETQDA